MEASVTPSSIPDPRPIVKSPSGSIWIFTDATFLALDGRSTYGFSVWFNGSFLYTLATSGQRITFSKEAETRLILFMLGKANDLGLSRIHIFSNNAKVVEGIK